MGNYSDMQSVWTSGNQFMSLIFSYNKMRSTWMCKTFGKMHYLCLNKVWFSEINEIFPYKNEDNLSQISEANINSEQCYKDIHIRPKLKGKIQRY